MQAPGNLDALDLTLSQAGVFVTEDKVIGDLLSCMRGRHCPGDGPLAGPPVR
ncbi:MAG TPA: hypothetical protein VIY52_19800 [Streptosporangiaceae bacterium]